MLIINYLRFEVVLGLLWVPNEFLCPGLKLQFVRLTMITSSERNYYQWLQVLSGYILAVSTPYIYSTPTPPTPVSVLSMSVWWGSIYQLWWQSFLWKSQLLCRPSVVWTFGKGVTVHPICQLTWKLRKWKSYLRMQFGECPVLVNLCRCLSRECSGMYVIIFILWTIFQVFATLAVVREWNTDFRQEGSM